MRNPPRRNSRKCSTIGFWKAKVSAGLPNQRSNTSPRRNRGTFSAAALSARARKFRLWMSSWFRWGSAGKIARSGESGNPFSIGNIKIAQEISRGVGDDAALGNPCAGPLAPIAGAVLHDDDGGLRGGRREDRRADPPGAQPVRGRGSRDGAGRPVPAPGDAERDGQPEDGRGGEDLPGA